MAGPRTNRRGLTLLELVIALVIAALLLSLSVPPFGGWLARHRVRAAAQHLAQDMGEARHEAVRLGKTLYMVYRTGPDWCYAVALDAAADCRQPSAALLKAVAAKQHPGVDLAAASTHAFDGRNGLRRGTEAASGVYGGQGAARLVSAKGDQLAVQVSALGRPTVCAPAKSWSDIARC